jgi:hypothetical protein
MPTAKELESFANAIKSLMGHSQNTDHDFLDFEHAPKHSALEPTTEPEKPVPNPSEAQIERYAKLVRNELKIERSPSNSYIIVVANRSSTDGMLRIRCQGGNAISGYVYDHLNDSYCVRGIDYCSLGYVPISFRLTMEHSNWNICVPTPENVLRRFMTKKQKTDLKNFKEHYKDCKIFFLQLVD